MSNSLSPGQSAYAAGTPANTPNAVAAPAADLPASVPSLSLSQAGSPHAQLLAQVAAAAKETHSMHAHSATIRKELHALKGGPSPPNDDDDDEDNAAAVEGGHSKAPADDHREVELALQHQLVFVAEGFMAEHHAMSGELDKQRQQADSAKRKEVLEQDLNKLRFELGAKDRALETAKAGVEEAKGRVAQAHEEAKGAREQAKALAQDKAVVEGEREKAVAQHGQLEAQLKQDAEFQHALEGKLKGMERDATKLKAKAAEKDGDIASLKGRVDERARTVASLQSSIAAAEAKGAEDAQESKGAAEEARKAAEAKAKALAKAEKAHRESEDTAKRLSADLNSQLAEARKHAEGELDGLRKQSKGHEDKLKELQGKVDAQGEIEGKLRRENAALAEQAQKALKRADKLEQDAQVDRAALEKEVQRMKQERDALSSSSSNNNSNNDNGRAEAPEPRKSKSSSALSGQQKAAAELKDAQQALQALQMQRMVLLALLVALVAVLGGKLVL